MGAQSGASATWSSMDVPRRALGCYFAEHPCNETICELHWDRAGARATCEFRWLSHTGQSVSYPLPKGSQLPELLVLISFEPLSCSLDLCRLFTRLRLQKCSVGLTLIYTGRDGLRKHVNVLYYRPVLKDTVPHLRYLREISFRSNASATGIRRRSCFPCSFGWQETQVNSVTAGPAGCTFCSPLSLAFLFGSSFCFCFFKLRCVLDVIYRQ